MPTAAIADAVIRLGLPLRVGPPGLRPMSPTMTCQGRARPVCHAGSTDVLLEAIDRAQPGDVLVVDNDGRTDEACVGDLIAHEALAAGLAGMVVWGLHRDTSELVQIGLPLFSLGALPAGPRAARQGRGDPFASARVGAETATSDDRLWADADGVILVARQDEAAVIEAATDIIRVERQQAARLLAGQTLREQLRLAEYLARRREDPSYDFRRHLREQGGAIET